MLAALDASMQLAARRALCFVASASPAAPCGPWRVWPHLTGLDPEAPLVQPCSHPNRHCPLLWVRALVTPPLPPSRFSFWNPPTRFHSAAAAVRGVPLLSMLPGA